MEINLDESINTSGEKLKEYMPSMKTEDEDNFIVLNGKLYFIGKGEYEKEIAEKLGIDTSLSNENFSIKDLKLLAGGVLPLGNSVDVPQNDDDESPEELIGTRLYDKLASNGTRWDIVMDYDESTKETGRFGTGYYYISPTEKYNINGEIVSFENGYIIDYENRSFISLSKRHEEWNIDKTIGARDGLILNLDSLNLVSGKWEKVDGEYDEVNKQEVFEFYETDPKTGYVKSSGTGIKKTGDVNFNSDSNTLDFNQNEDSGYLKLEGKYADMSQGFTLEMLLKFDRLAYKNGFNTSSWYSGFFCRMNTLTEFYGNGFRCSLVDGQDGSGIWVKPFNISTESKSFTNAKNLLNGDFQFETEDLINTEKWISIQMSFERDENYDEYTLYINGEKFGYGELPSYVYSTGLQNWNNDRSNIYVGACPHWENGRLYYIKGQVKLCRFYERGLSETEALSNFSLTLKYLESFDESWTSEL